MSSNESNQIVEPVASSSANPKVAQKGKVGKQSKGKERVDGNGKVVGKTATVLSAAQKPRTGPKGKGPKGSNRKEDPKPAKKPDTDGAEQPVEEPQTEAKGEGKPADPAPAKKAKFSDLHGWIKAFKHAIPKASEALAEEAKKNGWPVTPADRSVAVHGFSHLARDVSTLYVLSQLPSDLKRARVLDWFGSERNRRFNPATAGPFCTIEGKPSKEVLEVQWVSGPATSIAGDRARSAHFGREPVDPDLMFDLVLVQDVYQEGNSWKHDLSPETILNLCAKSRTGSVYLVCRRFVGWAGADGMSGSAEGVWYRDADGMIVFSPDANSPAYPKHPDIAWLESRNVNGLDVSFLQQFGAFSVYRCAPQAEGAQSLGPQVSDVGKVNWVEIEVDGVGSWLKKQLGLYRLRETTSQWLPSWVRRRLPRNRFMVHVPTYTSLVNQYSQRVATGITLDSCLLAVKKQFDASYEGKSLAERFPLVYQRILEDTVLAVMHVKRDEISHDLHTYRQEGSEAERKLLAARSAATPQGFAKRFTVWPYLAALAGGLAIWTVRRSHYGRVLSGSVMDDKMNEILLRVGFGDPTYVLRTRPAVALAVTANVAGEEVIRSVAPTFAHALWLMEAGLHFLTHGIWAIPTYLMHRTADNWVASYGHWGRVAAFSLHWVWNMSVLGFGYEVYDSLAVMSQENPSAQVLAEHIETTKGLQYFTNQGRKVENLEERFHGFLRSHVTAGRVEAMTFATAIPANVTIPSYTSRTMKGPADFRGKITIVVDGTKCSTPEEALERLDDCTLQEARNVMYPILITNGLLWEPAKNDKNLLVAILHRTHNDPFVDAEPADVRHQRWRELAARAVGYGLFPLQPSWLPTIEECVAIMGKRGRRILQAYMAVEERGEGITLKKTITEKWNETISAEKNLGDCVTMKPRAIVNLDPIYHAMMTQWARAIADVLHHIFDGRVHYIRGHPVRIFFAAGYDQQHLNEVGEAMASGETVIAVAGDDSCVAWGPLSPDPSEPFGEADQGQFDHTQDEGPLEASHAWLEALGAPPWFVAFLDECCSGPYRLKTNRMIVKGQAGTQMPTGITLTTVMNSMDTTLMYVDWVEWLVQIAGTKPDMAALGKRLGFIVKYHSKRDLGQVTFLRGWWRLTAEGQRVWMPLPSALLKLGKILRDPREITYVMRQGKRTMRSREEANRIVAWALARCYQGISPDYPLLGAFLRALTRLGKRTNVRVVDIIESAAYKPKMMDGNADREEAMAAVCERYQIERSDIERVEALFSQVRSLPAYVEDPVFYRLMDTDYA